MSIVLSEHALSELESLLAEVKHEIAEREAALTSSEVPVSEASSPATSAEASSVETPTPVPGRVADAPSANAPLQPASKSGTLKRPHRPPSASASAAVVEERKIENTLEPALEPADSPPPAVPISAADDTPAPAIRYVHPASRTLTWTGEGTTPEWITAYLAHGGSWSAMENAAEKLAASHRRDARLMSTRTPTPERNR